MKKKLIIAVMSCVLIISSYTTVCATTETDPEVLTKVACENITEDTLDLSVKEKQKYEEYQEGLAENIESELKNKDTCQKDIEMLISEYAEENSEMNTVGNKIMENTGVSDDLELLKADEFIEEDVINEYTDVFSIDENTDIVITPTSIYLDELEVEYCDDMIEEQLTGLSIIKNILIEPCYAASKWKIVKVATKRTLYTSIGKAATSVHTGGKIKYNGSKATYYSDFYGYYNLNYTTYRNLTFDKVREASGKSYQFYAYGTFYKEAQGISNKSKKISCKVKCSPTGKITKSYYPSL